MNDIIESVLMELTYEFVSSSEEFAIVIDNHNNWDKPLPERLRTAKQFILNMQNTDLEDSYIAENGDIILTAGIDDVVYTKVLEVADIHCVGYIGLPALVIKQYRDTPTMEPLSPSMPSDEALSHSMETFKKYNPSLFAAGARVSNYTHKE